MSPDALLRSAVLAATADERKTPMADETDDVDDDGAVDDVADAAAAEEGGVPLVGADPYEDIPRIQYEPDEDEISDLADEIGSEIGHLGARWREKP